MSLENLEIVRRLYAAWDRGEHPGPAELLDPEIEYVNPAGAIEPGVKRGRVGFAQAVANTLEGWSSWQMEPESFEASGNQVAVSVRFRARARRSGIEFQGRESALVTLRNGRVIRYEWFHGPDDARETLRRASLGAGFRVRADAYERFMGRYSRQLAPRLIEFAGIRSGMRVLDVGCGPGVLSVELVRRLGAGSVAAVDPSPPFIDACRAQLPDVEAAVAGAESLPFDDGAFDAALSQLVVNFMADAEAGVREMARVTRPGGTVAACVWDYAGEMTLLRAFWAAARRVDPERGAAADEGVVMSWVREDELAELWRRCGLKDVRFGSLEVSSAYAGFEELWTPLPEGVGHAGAFTKALAPSEQLALRDALRQELGVGDGSFELTARAWSAAGTVAR